MSSQLSDSPAQRVLFVGGCTAPYHLLEPSIAPVRAAFEALGLSVDVTGIYHPKRFPEMAPERADTDAELYGDYGTINAETLAQYALVALFTTGQGQGEDVAALLDFVRNGGALVGFHCAADSFQTNADYVAAIGGLFRTHPAPLDIDVEFVDTEHPITQGLAPFTVRDELYLFRDYDPARVHLLAQTHSYPHYPEQLDSPTPICWVREEGKGRIFYISLGHFPEVMADASWQELVRRGTTWALGR